MVKHVIKGFVELIRDLFDFELFAVDLILDVINPVVQLCDVHFTVFVTGFSYLEPLHKLMNFVLELLLPFCGFLGRDHNCFMFSPTVSNSCSTSLSFPSANS